MHLKVTTDLCHVRYAIIDLDVLDNMDPRVSILLYVYFFSCSYFAQLIALCRRTIIETDNYNNRNNNFCFNVEMFKQDKNCNPIAILSSTYV